MIFRAYHSKLEINLGRHGLQPPTGSFSDLQDFSWEIRIKPKPTIKKTWLIVVSQFFMNVTFKDTFGGSVELGYKNWPKPGFSQKIGVYRVQSLQRCTSFVSSLGVSFGFLHETVPEDLLDMGCHQYPKDLTRELEPRAGVFLSCWQKNEQKKSSRPSQKTCCGSKSKIIPRKTVDAPINFPPDQLWPEKLWPKSPYHPTERAKK